MKDYVVGIGAANIDIYGKSHIQIKEKYDHPSDIFTSIGGVSRNILENIQLLGVDTVLLSAVGDDFYGNELIKKTNDIGIDTSNILKVKNARTSVFMQIQNKNNDMQLALCDMNVIKNIDIKYLKKKAKILKNAKALIIDPSLDNESIKYLLDTYKEKEIFVDPVSCELSLKLKPFLSKIYCLKPNISELEALSDMKIGNNDDLIVASKKMIKKGIKKLFVSLGKNGFLYVDDSGNIIKRKFKSVKKVVNASGAGDACFATIVYCFIKNINISDTIDMALAAGISAISSLSTTNKKLSVNQLKRIIKEYKK